MPFRTNATTPDGTVRHRSQEPFDPKVLGSSPSRPQGEKALAFVARRTGHPPVETALSLDPPMGLW